MTVGDMLESVRPWISTAALMGLLEFARRLWVQNRQLRLVENKDDRDGYGALITTLQNAVTQMETKHAADMAAMKVEHAAQIAAIALAHTAHLDRIADDHRRCEERLAKIEGELMGFHRQALLRSHQEAVALPASGLAVSAGERAIRAATDALEKGRIE
jgi:hypothetical protein